MGKGQGNESEKEKGTGKEAEKGNGKGERELERELARELEKEIKSQIQMNREDENRIWNWKGKRSAHLLKGVSTVVDSRSGPCVVF